MLSEESVCVCVGTRVFPLCCSSKVFRFLKTFCFSFRTTRRIPLKLKQINLHWKPSTGVDRGRDRKEGTPSTGADTRWPQPGEKLAPMIDSLNENLMENSFASHKLVSVQFGLLRFQFLWGPLGDALSSCSTSWSSPPGVQFAIICSPPTFASL